MAEELAGRLAKDFNRYGKKPLVLNPEEIEVEDLPKIIGILIVKFFNFLEVENAFLLLCVATYGEGDPTDNARELHGFLTNNDCDLNGLSYTVCFKFYVLYFRFLVLVIKHTNTLMLLENSSTKDWRN